MRKIRRTGGIVLGLFLALLEPAHSEETPEGNYRLYTPEEMAWCKESGKQYGDNRKPWQVWTRTKPSARPYQYVLCLTERELRLIELKHLCEIRGAEGSVEYREQGTSRWIIFCT